MSSKCSFTRVKGQIDKLRSQPKILEECDKIIKEQEEKGIIEKVSELEKAENSHYLPNQTVVRENAETTKVRMVFDASSKEGIKGTFLNDCLHVGLPMTPMLFDILLRFRENNVSLVGDVEKAFLNIEVDPIDRDCLRFLWVEDIYAKDIIVLVFRFNRVVFGLNSSPFLLNAVIRYHLDMFKETDPEFAAKLSNSFFVDDLCVSVRTVGEAIELYKKSCERMQQAGFKLRKWKTSDQTVREYISRDQSKENENASGHTYAKKTLNGSENVDGKSKVLGIIWDENKDCLEIELDKSESKGTDIKKVHTKRSLLSALAKLFDPLGIVSPVTVIGKLFFQQLCIEGIDWDDELPKDMLRKWEALLSDLDKVESIVIPRCIHENDEGDNVRYSLHGFGDASSKAYCAVIYLVCETADRTYCRLICSKTRIAPIKKLTIPRLELMSAKILASLMETVKNALSSQIDIHEIRLWLDSKTALFWIRNSGEWKQFVQHRVNEILRIADKELWGHCPGKDNPADLGSRGVNASKLVESTSWWEGPKWLSMGKRSWPQSELLEETLDVVDEKKKSSVVVCTVESELKGLSNVIDASRYSTVNKLLRVSAWVLRFIKNIKSKHEQERIREGHITVAEIGIAEGMWIKDCQSMFSKERDEKMFKSLGVFEDDGILRCKGKLDNSSLEPEAKWPILLQKDHRVTELIIQESHKRVKHMKVRATLADLRTRYWVPKGRQCVKRIVNRCITCKYLDGKSYDDPKSAQMPDFRAQEAPSFQRVGIDFAGPLFIKSSNSDVSKVYIALFSCCSTRAIHLELVEDLSFNTFIRSFRRFIARRGVPSLVISDNAKTFKAAAKFVDRLNKESDFQDFMLEKRIEWKFNLERTPWWGGFFERMVGTVKRCLRKILGNARLSYDELNTCLVEVEGTINDRPLTYVYDELSSEPLTP